MRVLPISLAADDPKHVMAKATRSISVVERRFALATLLNVYSAAWRNTGTDVCHISLDGRRIFRKSVKGWPPAEAHVTEAEAVITLDRGQR